MRSGGLRFKASLGKLFARPSSLKKPEQNELEI
jgi:hypothetical protein